MSAKIFTHITNVTWALVLLAVCQSSLALTKQNTPAPKNISQLEELIAKNPNDLKSREVLGSMYFENKKFDKVISTLAPYANEIASDALINLAHAYGEQKDSLNEIRVLQIYAEKDGKRFRPHYYLGLAYKKNNKPDEAAKELRLSIQYAPGHRPSYNALLDIFTETKQNYESRVLLNDMVRNFGPKKEFTNLSCKLYAADGFLVEALETCKKAVNQDKAHADNHIYLAQTYYNQDNREAAERIFKAAGRSFKKSEFAQYAVGEFYLQEKNYPTAVRYLEAAVNINPNVFRSQYTLAVALFEAKDYTRALTHFDKSCRLDKSNETMTTLKNSAGRLRKDHQHNIAEGFEKKAAVCQQL